MSADLTVAVVHHETPRLLGDCLTAIRAAAPEATVIVVDTGESEPLPGEPTLGTTGVQVLRQANHSYSAAVNRGLKECRTNYFVQMNADVIVRPDTFTRLRDALIDTGAAMAGPLPLDARGRLQRHGALYRRHQGRVQREGIIRVPWLSGCLQLVRMDAVRAVGGMDPTLRFYNEDVEWCLRLRRNGFTCVLVNAPVTHLGGASTPSDPALIAEGLRGGYVLTRRYRGSLERKVHRVAVAAGVAALGLLERNENRRAGYRLAAELFRKGSFDSSPVGRTLSERRPLPGGRRPGARSTRESVGTTETSSGAPGYAAADEKERAE